MVECVTVVLASCTCVTDDEYVYYFQLKLCSLFGVFVHVCNCLWYDCMYVGGLRE